MLGLMVRRPTPDWNRVESLMVRALSEVAEAGLGPRPDHRLRMRENVERQIFARAATIARAAWSTDAEPQSAVGRTPAGAGVSARDEAGSILGLGGLAALARRMQAKT